MKRQGRRSPADKAAAEYHVTLQPSRRLTSAEQRVWDSVCIATDRLVLSDAILLTHYCSVACAFDNARTVADKQKIGSLVLQYARALRLTPHSRFDARAGQRAVEHALQFSAADDRLLGGYTKQ
jgi:hypothetical protein